MLDVFCWYYIYCRHNKPTHRLRFVLFSSRNDFEIIFELSNELINLWVVLFVPVKPKLRPNIAGFKSSYRVGDQLQATCYINNTYPAANLTWFVNGKMVRVVYLRKWCIILMLQIFLRSSLLIVCRIKYFAHGRTKSSRGSLYKSRP